MKQIKKITKIGKSFYFLLDKDLIKKLKLQENDYICVDVEKLKIDEDITPYRCLYCNSLLYFKPDEEPYCPTCDSDNIEIIEGEILN